MLIRLDGSGERLPLSRRHQQALDIVLDQSRRFPGSRRPRRGRPTPSTPGPRSASPRSCDTSNENWALAKQAAASGTKPANSTESASPRSDSELLERGALGSVADETDPRRAAQQCERTQQLGVVLLGSEVCDHDPERVGTSHVAGEVREVDAVLDDVDLRRVHVLDRDRTLAATDSEFAIRALGSPHRHSMEPPAETPPVVLPLARHPPSAHPDRHAQQPSHGNAQQVGGLEVGVHDIRPELPQRAPRPHDRRARSATVGTTGSRRSPSSPPRDRGPRRWPSEDRRPSGRRSAPCARDGPARGRAAPPASPRPRSRACR